MQNFFSDYIHHINRNNWRLSFWFYSFFCWHAKRIILYYTIFSFMDKSHNSLLRELFIGSLNKADISPVQLCTGSINVCVKCALKSVRSLSTKVGHYMEEEVLKLDTAWKKKCWSWTLHGRRSVEVGHYMKEEEVQRVS